MAQVVPVSPYSSSPRTSGKASKDLFESGAASPPPGSGSSAWSSNSGSSDEKGGAKKLSKLVVGNMSDMKDRDPKPSMFRTVSDGVASRSDGHGVRDSSKRGSGGGAHRWLVQDHRDPKRNREPCWKKCASKIVENASFVLLTTSLTVFALLGEDLKIIFTDKPADKYFNVITVICMAVFSVEIVLSCMGKEDYIFGFFFFLDVISTATLFLDLSWLTEEYESSEASEGGDELRSGRTARVGAKAGRVVRVLRLVRILKLYKAIYEARARQQADEDDWGDENVDEEARMEAMMRGVQESRVGKKLSELTTRRVIVLVLTMLLVVPFLEVNANTETPSSAEYGARDVFDAFIEWQTNTAAIDGRGRYEDTLLKYIYYHNWFKDDNFLSHLFWVGVRSRSGDIEQFKTRLRLSESTVLAWSRKVASPTSTYRTFGTLPANVEGMLPNNWTTQCSTTRMKRLGFSLLQFGSDEPSSGPIDCCTDLRTSECFEYSSPSTDLDGIEFEFVFFFDTRPYAKGAATFGICVTFFICLVLVVASLMFSSDANKLVLNPLEQMIKRVKEIRNDPLVAMKMADEEFMQEEREKAKKRRTQSLTLLKRACLGSNAVPETMETVILEKTIIKLGSLLALGFGEAGANIIGHNMEASDSAGVNVMIPGIKVDCIVGKVRINDFSVATEVLQSRVMTFVNQIAEIVHGIVDEFHGAPNKNNGDTFLVIWRISDVNDLLIPRMADMSVVAVARIYGAIHRSLTLSGYRTHPGLQQRLGSNCRVNLSFGLHAGWAIEGAVGTEFKIDASYLSPNVSIAASVELATATYRVPILISQSVIDLATPALGAKCRLVDNVIIKGSPLPIQLYSLDLDYQAVHLDPPRDPRITWNSRQRFKVRQYLESVKKQNLSPSVTMARSFDLGEDVSAMRRPYRTEFMQLFKMGYQNYSQGEWQVARRLLSDTKHMLRMEDGPSVALLRFMETPYQFRPPPGWQGVRELGVDDIFQ